MRSLRRALPTEAREQRSHDACDRARELEGFRQASTMLAFSPIHGELHPGALVAEARRRGKRVALPRIDFDAGVLRIHLWEEGASLEEGGFGVPEPRPDAPQLSEGEVDLALVPALAVDPAGYRIGYGKGFYDQLLPTLPRAVRCALVFDFQILAEVPRTAGDVPVHVIATDSRIIMVDEAGTA